MKTYLRLSFAAAAIATLTLVPLCPAAANDFTDSCNAMGNGMFQPKDCACLDGKATASDDRTVLITYFKTMGAISKGQQADMTGDVVTQMQKASGELLPKYVAECVK